MTRRSRPRWHSWLTVVLAVAAVLFGSWLHQLTPTLDDIRSAPFRIDSRIGQPTRFRLGTVTVNEFTLATMIATSPGTLRTTGIWLIAELELTPSTQVAGVTALYVETRDGTILGGAQAANARCGPAQPGFILTCHLPVEVPPEVLPGAKLLIPANQLPPDTLKSSDDIVVVDLELDEAQLSELVATAGIVELPGMSMRGE